MPMVAVYVRAARWRELASRTSDPAEQVREHVRSRLDAEHERAQGQARAEAQEHAVARILGSREHFRPDPKPGARA